LIENKTAKMDKLSGHFHLSYSV